MLFKYRSSREFNYFVDIVLHNRLYTAPYFDLNDPMEGHYTHNGDKKNEQMVKAIREGKGKLRICSLSETSEDALMWAHYADGSKGMVIGVNIPKDHEAIRVCYNYQIPDFDSFQCQHTYPDYPKKILSCKLKAWAYEKERRIFTRKSYVPVEIGKIILGAKMPEKDKALIRKLVNRLDKNISIEDADARGLIRREARETLR